MKKYILSLGIALCLLSAHPASAASTFSLAEGWNLVSSDVMFGVTAQLESFLKSGGGLFVLNPKNKQYSGGSGDVRAVTESVESAQALLPDGDNVSALGWWVYTPKSTPVTVDFAIGQDRIDYYKGAYHFYQGWNLVGMSEVMVGKSLSEVSGTCKVVSAYQFTQGGWRKQSEEDLREKFTTDSLGHALAMKVENDCKFNFVQKVVPPSLPR